MAKARRPDQGSHEEASGMTINAEPVDALKAMIDLLRADT